MALVRIVAISAPGVDAIEGGDEGIEGIDGADDPGWTTGGAPVGISAKSDNDSGGVCAGAAGGAANAAIHSGAWRPGEVAMPV
jgi:hypothetical protein